MNKVLLLLLFAFTTQLNAQKISIKDDTVKVDGKAQFILKKTGGLSPEWHVYNFEKKELIFANFDSEDRNVSNGGCYHVVFLESGKRAALMASMSFGKYFAGKLAESNVVVDGKINPEGEAKFILKYPEKNYNLNNQFNPVQDNQYSPISRDKSKPVMISGKTVLQGGILIARWESSSKAEGALIVTHIRYYLPNNVLVAEATISGVNSKECNIVTSKDNQKHYFVMTSFQKELEIAEYLVKLLYI